MNFFIYLLKKKIIFLKKYLFELYLDFFNSKFLKSNSNFIIKLKISLVKNIINLKLNEVFVR
ncbi:MAG: hypothetical protein ACSHUF_00680 [Candidatus Nasuia deltocephalinicola]